MKGKKAKRSVVLLPEYDLRKLKGGERGKYYQQAVAGSSLVLIEPELMEAFPDAAAVNRALRLLAKTAAAATSPRIRRRVPKKSARC